MTTKQVKFKNPDSKILFDILAKYAPIAEDRRKAGIYSVLFANFLALSKDVLDEDPNAINQAFEAIVGKSRYAKKPKQKSAAPIANGLNAGGDYDTGLCDGCLPDGSKDTKDSSGGLTLNKVSSPTFAKNGESLEQIFKVKNMKELNKFLNDYRPDKSVTMETMVDVVMQNMGLKIVEGQSMQDRKELILEDILDD